MIFRILLEGFQGSFQLEEHARVLVLLLSGCTDAAAEDVVQNPEDRSEASESLSLFGGHYITLYRGVVGVTVEVFIFNHFLNIALVAVKVLLKRFRLGLNISTLRRFLLGTSVNKLLFDLTIGLLSHRATVS
jgi:hypothetical protein